MIFIGGILGLGILSLYFIYNPSDFEFFPKCPFYELTGYFCPGCGSQRALHRLLHFDIKGAFSQNALFIPAILTLATHFLTLVIQKRRSQNIKTILHYKNSAWVVLVCVITFWLLRNLSFFPFYLLAPNS